MLYSIFIGLETVANNAEQSNTISEELNTYINLDEKGGKWYLSIGRNRNQELTLIGNDKLRTKLNEPMTIEFLKQTNDRAIGLKASTKGVNGIIFKKIDGSGTDK